MTGKKTEILRIPLTPEELSLVEKLARRERLIRTEWARILFRQVGRQAGLWPPENDLESDDPNTGQKGKD